MREVTETIKLYKFGDDSTVDAKIIDRFRESSYGDWIIDDAIASFNALKDKINAEIFDYSISLTSDRGEHITICEYCTDSLKDLIKDKDNMPLTGMCYDFDLLDAMEKQNLYGFIEMLHSDYESILEPEQIKEHCDANEYEFTNNGNIY